ncbi:MAG: hypothetical protein A2Y73_01015 [Chloroflexi bacterium RBG_13_56_8]|nr:MAG: hypothetical protein A2Y73_01015 [Chloroflexi bacterium RBG_13_56_8]
MKMESVESPSFSRYGRIWSHLDASEAIAKAKAILPETDRVAYQASVSELEEPSAFNDAVQSQIYGGMPVEVGWCYGHNLQLRGVEYHKGIEVLVCITDLVLLLGHRDDIVFGDEIRYDMANVVAFYAPAGSVVELFPSSLHMAPVHTTKGGSFANLVILPKGTNTPMEMPIEKLGEARLFSRTNSWVIVHVDATPMIERGLYPGAIGEPVVVNPI